MKDLKKILFKSLAKNKIAAISRGAMLNKIISDYIKENLKFNYQFNGKLEQNIYIIKSPNSSLSSMLFLHKKKVLDHINLKLKSMDLDEISDIKII